MNTYSDFKWVTVKGVTAICMDRRWITSYNQGYALFEQKYPSATEDKFRRYIDNLPHLTSAMDVMKSLKKLGIPLTAPQLGKQIFETDPAWKEHLDPQPATTDNKKMPIG